MGGRSKKDVQMLGTLWDVLFGWLFGCRHRNYSFPRSSRRADRSPAAAVTGIYVVCLRCGKELPYDWNAMRVVSLPHERSGIMKAMESYVGKMNA
jgi:hypothetical protein